MSLRPDPSHPGMNYNVTNLVRKALTLAGEAARAGHAAVGPEHVLLGLLRLGEGTALSVLERLGVDRDELDRRVEVSIGGGSPERGEREAIPYTTQAKKVLLDALAEARDLDAFYLDTGHVLLGLLRQTGTPACRVLNEAGVHIEDARAAAVEVWKARDGSDVGNLLWQQAEAELSQVIRASRAEQPNEAPPNPPESRPWRSQ